jgi:mono/diheme cytochrome c family protein
LLRRAVVPATCLLAALVASGCGAVGKVDSGDPSRGKQLFVAAPGPSQPSCGSCHTLANAKSQGTVGPNLDDAFASDKEQGFSPETIRNVVRGQIAYPEPPMPANLFSGQDADDVATYIALCAARPDCGVTAAKAVLAPPPTTTGPKGGGAAAPNGKEVFVSAGCGACHTLKDAGSTGTVGPNLDQLKPSRVRVAHQVEVGGGAMPPFKGQLSEAQIQAVARYVSSVAGK